MLIVQSVVRISLSEELKREEFSTDCEGYPECDFSSWQRPSKKKCPKCGGLMIEKGKKLVCADIECGHVEDNTEA